MKSWATATVSSAASAALIVLIYVTPSPEPGFAGAAFGYNFSFFFPVVLLSCVCWSIALGFYLAFLRRTSRKSVLKIIVPPILLLPFTLQAAWIIRVLIMARQSV
jgi:hypothetical protein